MPHNPLHFTQFGCGQQPRCGISAAVVFAGFLMLIASLRQKTVYRVE